MTDEGHCLIVKAQLGLWLGEITCKNIHLHMYNKCIAD